MTTSSTEPGPILAECQALLEELREEFAGNPSGEYRQLAMLALEREQLVSYAYRKDILGERLDSLIAPPEVIELMRHAFTQVWRDEEAHTVLVRGTLIGSGENAIGLLRTTVEQTSGLLAGWSSALKHHVPRTAAPMRSVLVDGLAHAARVVGKLSPDLREELKHKSFRDFCLYNVDAEETAELCWGRLIDLEIELGGSNIEVFRRIEREEREHRMVFDAVASVLDEYDWMRSGTTAQGLAATLVRVGERFCPPEYRDEDPEPSAPDAVFGTGADVSVFDASSHSRIEGIAAAVDLLGDVAGKSVALLTSWMMGYSVDDRSTVIDPALVAELVQILHERGATVSVMDGPNLYSAIYENRSVQSVADHFGIAPECPVLDSTAEVVALEEQPILGPLEISKAWVDADLRISMVRMRSHPREHLHGCTAALESLVEGTAENVFWQRRYDHSVAALTVAIVAPPHLAILDAWADCPDGLFGIMAGRYVVHPGRLYASIDALSCDLIGLRHTGSARSINSPTIRRALEWFGDSRSQIEVHGTDDEIDGWRNPHDNIISGFLADLSYPVFAYLSRSGAVFAPPMDGAFTEIAPPPLPLRLVRRIARVALGLRPPATT